MKQKLNLPIYAVEEPAFFYFVPRFPYLVFVYRKKKQGNQKKEGKKNKQVETGLVEKKDK